MYVCIKFDKEEVVQVEAAKVAKVREVAIAKLKSLEKQKAEVEKTRDDIKYNPPPSPPGPHPALSCHTTVFASITFLPQRWQTCVAMLVKQNFC